MVEPSRAEVAPADLVRPWWRRARLWLVLVAVLVIGAALVSTLSDEPGRALDPGSAHQDGSKALARLLGRYGVSVTTTSSLDAALEHASRSAVVVTAPDEYSATQLRRLAHSAARLVLAAPGTRAVGLVLAGAEPDSDSDSGPNDFPGCADPGAAAAGEVSFPGGAITYLGGSSGATSCYGGALLTSPTVAVLGSAELLRNDHLDDDGVAALDINAITDSRRLSSVVWLLAGSDAAGSGPASIWDLFPDGAYRVFWWLIALAAVVALWRARRLGGVVPEPLPVVVHSAEVVEGHGRLYARAGARDRAAAALRAAAVARLGHRLGLARGASAEQVGVATAPLVRRSPADVVGVLAGPVPLDDLALMRLARDLDALEAAVGGSTEGRTHS